MKKKMIMTIGVALALAWTVGCGKKSAQHFGEPFTDAPQVAIAQLLESPDSFRRQSVRVKGEIERQCPAAGCWLFLNDGAGRSIRVELGDLQRLETAYARLNVSADDSAYLDRRIGELESRARR